MATAPTLRELFTNLSCSFCLFDCLFVSLFLIVYIIQSQLFNKIDHKIQNKSTNTNFHEIDHTPDVFPAFPKTLFRYIYRQSKLVCLVIFLSRNQLASLYMLQNELGTVQGWNKEPCHINQGISNLSKFRAIGLWVWPTRISFTKVILTECEFQRRFPKNVWLNPVVLPASFKKMGKQ